MRKGFVILIAAGAAVAVCGAAIKARQTENTRINRELRSLDNRVDSLEYDMTYNVKRVADFSKYDIDIDDDKY
jgi:predicted  nucleic acid-binding Zn-ribbon protein